VHFVGLYCVINVFYCYVLSCSGVYLVANRRRSDLPSANRSQGQLQTPQSVTIGTQDPSPVLFFRRMQSAYGLV